MTSELHLPVQYLLKVVTKEKLSFLIESIYMEACMLIYEILYPSTIPCALPTYPVLLEYLIVTVLRANRPSESSLKLENLVEDFGSFAISAVPALLD